LRTDVPARRRLGAVLPGLLQLAAHRRVPAFRVRVAGGLDRGTADVLAHGALLPRPRPGEAARHQRRDTLAPGPAVLLRGRRAERELLDAARSGLAGRGDGVRRRLAPLGPPVSPRAIRRHAAVRE